MDKIKQNKNYCAVYKSLSIIVCVLILFSCLFFGSYADYTEPDNGIEFTELPVIDPLMSGSEYIRDNYFLAGTVTAGGVACNMYIGSTVENTVAFICGFYTYACIVDGSEGSYYVKYLKTSNLDIYQSYDVLINKTKDNVPGVLYGDVYNINGFRASQYDSLSIPNYSEVGSSIGLASALYAINNLPPDVSGYELNYTIPAGNVIVIDVTNLNPSITMTMHTPTLEYQVTSTQYCGVLSEIPNPITLPLSGTTPINWQASGKKDSFGRASQWIDTEIVSGITSDHGHAYFVIANPFSNNYTSANGSDTHFVSNPNINVNVSSCNYAKIYQLNETFNAGTFNNQQAGDTMSVNYNPDTRTWDTINDTTGEVDTPVYGGNNQGETAINSVTDWLENISNKISSFFTGPINAIGTLVGAGSNFFRTLSGLYSWLPSPVLSVLTSALIVVITVGVIKVFI